MKKLLLILGIFSCITLQDTFGLKSDRKYGDVRYDSAFKHMMDDMNIAKSVINTFCPTFQNGNAITELKKESESLPVLKAKGEKQVFMDFRAVTEKNEHITIEMQYKQHENFDERGVFYLASVHANQLNGEQLSEKYWYKNLTKTVALHILDYETNKFIDKGKEEKKPKKREAEKLAKNVNPLIKRVTDHPMRNKDFIKYYLLTDQYSGQIIDALQVVQIELPRAYGLLKLKDNKSISKGDMIKWWVKLFEDSDSFKDEEMHQEAPEIIQAALKRLDMDQWNPELKKAYNLDGTDYTAYTTAINGAKAEGRAEGEKDKAIAIAKNLITMNLDTAKIAQATDLSKEEIEALKQEFM